LFDANINYSTEPPVTEANAVRLVLML